MVCKYVKRVILLTPAGFVFFRSTF